MTSTETANGEKQMVWGLNLDSWNILIVAFGVISGIFVVLTGAATYIAFGLQKTEAVTASAAFDRYKLETGKTIAEANARASEADLARAKLESKLAPRRLDTAAQGRIEKVLRQFEGLAVELSSYNSSPEADQFLQSLEATLKNAGLKATISIMGGILAGGTQPAPITLVATPDRVALAEALAGALIKEGVAEKPIPMERATGQPFFRIIVSRKTFP